MGESTKPVSNIFSILADPVRRYVLYYLGEQETAVFFRRLTTRVATGHTDSDPDAVDDAARSEMRTALSSCPICERTYISKAMDACSKCGGFLTQIPPEREIAVSTNRT